ncbi:unnamed protein product [Lactuca virosa]|uniref:Uncharacterized protein n=1 Tax=Lactuca virosa TaxID=75947 RepID=A0AAU9NNC3_9ASTR|nr:unnamed protein product [Lactuca virosa]
MQGCDSGDGGKVVVSGQQQWWLQGGDNWLQGIIVLASQMTTLPPSTSLSIIIIQLVNFLIQQRILIQLIAPNGGFLIGFNRFRVQG